MMLPQRFARHPCTMFLAALATLVFGAGCATPPVLSQRFDARSAGYVLTDGPNVIEGRASLTSRRGYVHTCRYSGVTLIPATAYSSERMTLAFGNINGGYANDRVYERLPANEYFARYVRYVACDKDGRFRFERVANGRYFLVADITWLVRWARFGGAAMQSIEVTGGEHRTVVLASNLPY
jgi:hypothetical protein